MNVKPKHGVKNVIRLEKTLPQTRQETIEAFKRSSKEINRKLKEVRGNIDELTDEQLKKQIKEMDIMIKQLSRIIVLKKARFQK
ncbi:ADP-ribosyltransferase [Paenibacillus larvae]|nr:ADP-ribosyltransferase [Paenibacillus larvae]MDT2294553.1 ADP-ribosyltransferase [Paenibacillus larvae]